MDCQIIFILITFGIEMTLEITHKVARNKVLSYSKYEKQKNQFLKISQIYSL